MPLPTPNPGEKDFMDRCLSDPVVNKEFPDTNQRYAVCQSLKKKAQKKQGKGEAEPDWEDYKKAL